MIYVNKRCPFKAVGLSDYVTMPKSEPHHNWKDPFENSVLSIMLLLEMIKLMQELAIQGPYSDCSVE
jgi:hypothetical protein